MGRLTMSLQMVSCIKVLDHVIFKMELLSTEFYFFKDVSSAEQWACC